VKTCKLLKRVSNHPKFIECLKCVIDTSIFTWTGKCMSKC